MQQQKAGRENHLLFKWETILTTILAKVSLVPLQAGDLHVGGGGCEGGDGDGGGGGGGGEGV